MSLMLFCSQALLLARPFMAFAGMHEAQGRAHSAPQKHTHTHSDTRARACTQPYKKHTDTNKQTNKQTHNKPNKQTSKQASKQATNKNTTKKKTSEHPQHSSPGQRPRNPQPPKSQSHRQDSQEDRELPTGGQRVILRRHHHQAPGIGFRV